MYAKVDLEIIFAFARKFAVLETAGSPCGSRLGLRGQVATLNLSNT